MPPTMVADVTLKNRGNRSLRSRLSKGAVSPVSKFLTRIAEAHSFVVDSRDRQRILLGPALQKGVEQTLYFLQRPFRLQGIRLHQPCLHVRVQTCEVLAEYSTSTMIQ